MDPDYLHRHIEIYRSGILDDTLPFWFPRCVDAEHGGYITALDHDGSVLQTDKSVWFQGRFSWILSTMYNEVKKDQAWLDAAKSGVEFILKHCFDTDGRMFFAVTQDGRPLRKRRYVFSETFAIIALAAYGVAADSAEHKRRAVELFKQTLQHLRSGTLEPKTNPATRAMKGLAVPMILLVTAQELRSATDDPMCTQVWV